MARDRPVYRAIFLLVLAPVGAAVTVAALLLFGARPHIVFIVGFALKWVLNRVGVHAPNSIGVVSTLVFWWAVIVVLGLAWDRRRHRLVP